MKKLFTFLILACAFLVGQAATFWGDRSSTTTKVVITQNETSGSTVTISYNDETLLTVVSSLNNQSGTGNAGQFISSGDVTVGETKYSSVQLRPYSEFVIKYGENVTNVEMYVQRASQNGGALTVGTESKSINGTGTTENPQYPNLVELSDGITVSNPNNQAFNILFKVTTYSPSWKINYAEIASIELPVGTIIYGDNDSQKTEESNVTRATGNQIKINSTNTYRFSVMYNGKEIIPENNVTTNGVLRFANIQNGNVGLYGKNTTGINNVYGIVDLLEGEIVEIAYNNAGAIENLNTPTDLYNLKLISETPNIYTFTGANDSEIKYNVYRLEVINKGGVTFTIPQSYCIAYISVNPYMPSEGYYLVGDMTTDYDGGWVPNPSYKFQQNTSKDDSSDSETAVTTYTLTVSSMSSSNEFYVVYVNEEGDQTVYSLDTSKDSSLAPNNEFYDLSSTYKNPLKLNASYLNLTFTLTPDAQPDESSANGPLVNLYYTGTPDTDNTYIITPGNDQTMQSGEFITENDKTVLVITTVSNGALAYIYIPSSLTEVYYSLTSGEVTASDVTLTKANIQTDNVGKFFTVPLVVDTEGTISVYPTQEGSAEETFSYKVISGTPLAVEAVEAVDGPAEYFNLQGVKIANPDHGIFIKVQNGKASKVIL